MAEVQPEKHDEYIDPTQGRGHTRVHLSLGKLVLNNFLGGLAWGVGTVLGATIIVGVTLFIISKLGTIPGIGHFFVNLLDQIQHVH